MKHIPNLFTLLNLVFGCFAILFTLQNGIGILADENGSTWIDIPERLWYASLFIGLAALVDFLDGFLARLLGAGSEMGKQLDSLSDIVSFGVAPGMIMYQFLRLSYAKETNALDTSVIWLAPAFLIPCAAAWRLARFNLDPAQSYTFKGLPVPAVGIFVAAFPLIYHHSNDAWIAELLLNKWFLYAVIAMLCWLMVSKLPLMALKFGKASFSHHYPKLIILAIAIAAWFFLHWLALPVTVLAYVLVSLLFQNKSA